jgi:hypothetical protein
VVTAAAVVCTPPAMVLVAPVRSRLLRSMSGREKLNGALGSFHGWPDACDRAQQGKTLRYL